MMVSRMEPSQVAKMADSLVLQSAEQKGEKQAAKKDENWAVLTADPRLSSLAVHWVAWTGG
jgi:hypothetical protein